MRLNAINVLSLFDGCGGAGLALNNLDICYANYLKSETDKYASAVSKKRIMGVNLGDVNYINWLSLPKIHLLIGGSPCQDLSSAGQRQKKGLKGDRSGLFWKFVEALEYLRPEYFLLENVKSMSNKNKDIITRALKYKPIMIDSALLTAQSRKRYYWTNIPNITTPEDRGYLLKDIIEEGTVDRDKSYTIEATYYKGTNLKGYLGRRRRQIVFTDTNEKGFRKLTPIECERLQGLPDNYTKEGIVRTVDANGYPHLKRITLSDTQRYKMIGNGFTIPVIEHILSFMDLENFETAPKLEKRSILNV